LPQEGEQLQSGDLSFEIVQLDGRNIDKVKIRRIEEAI
jgi:CBS domain containing-hemolysin-like protein